MGVEIKGFCTLQEGLGLMRGMKYGLMTKKLVHDSYQLEQLETRSSIACCSIGGACGAEDTQLASVQLGEDRG
jgi:hypothetical protein